MRWILNTDDITALIVVSTTNHFLHSRTKDDSLYGRSAEFSMPEKETYMFILSSVRPLDIAERRVVLNNSRRHKVVQLFIMISI